MRNLHRKLFKNSSPFAKAAICALVIGIGDLLATGADLIWLFGDMSRDAQSYHYIVLIGLCLAFLVMALSFFWLYMSINKFLKKKEEATLKYTVEHYIAYIEADKDIIKTKFDNTMDVEDFTD